MNSKTSNISKVEQTDSISLLSFSSSKPYEQVILDFEKQLGNFDQAKAMSSSANLQDTIKQMEGATGLMIIGVFNMDRILPAFTSSSMQVRQYQMGNPLIASSMAQHNILAALYAPPRVLIYTKEDKTWISYDQPSTAFGKLASAEIDQTAQDLDRKFEHLARTALA